MATRRHSVRVRSRTEPSKPPKKRARSSDFSDGTPEPSKAVKRTRCGECEGCLAEECRKCKNCLDKKKYGGPGKRNQACELRQCKFLKKKKSDEDTTSEAEQMDSMSESDYETETPEGTDSEEDQPQKRGRRRRKSQILPSSEDDSPEETPPIEITEPMSHDAIGRKELRRKSRSEDDSPEETPPIKTPEPMSHDAIANGETSTTLLVHITRALLPSNLNVLELIGEGFFGSVHKAQYRNSGMLCAVKLPIQQRKSFLCKFRKECELLKDIKHPNIVACFGVSSHSESGNPMLVMELMDQNLTQLLQDRQKDLPEYIQIDISFQVASALAYLHSKDIPIVHRDLSSNNVLIKGNTVKVADFGMARLLEDGMSLTGLPGMDAYMPPEAYNDSPDYCEKLDIFSLGVLMVQVITRKRPAPTSRIRDEMVASQTITLVREVERRKNHIDLVDGTHPLRPVFLKCLRDNSSERSTTEELVQSLLHCQNCERYFTSIKQALDDEASLNSKIDSLQQQLDSQKQQLMEKDSVIKVKEEQLRVQEEVIATNEKHIDGMNQLHQEQGKIIEKKEAQLKQLRDKHKQVLQEKEKKNEAQLKQLREKVAKQEEAIRIRNEDTERTKEQCKTWLQTIHESAPPFAKAWDKEPDGE